MPYADPTEQRAYNLELYLHRYATDPEFREDEACRKLAWYSKKRDEILARYREKRKKIRAARKSASVGKRSHWGRLPVAHPLQELVLLL